jgi:hypothetical protein
MALSRDGHVARYLLVFTPIVLLIILPVGIRSLGSRVRPGRFNIRTAVKVIGCEFPPFDELRHFLGVQIRHRTTLLEHPCGVGPLHETHLVHPCCSSQLSTLHLLFHFGCLCLLLLSDARLVFKHFLTLGVPLILSLKSDEVLLFSELCIFCLSLLLLIGLHPLFEFVVLDEELSVHLVSLQHVVLELSICNSLLVLLSSSFDFDGRLVEYRLVPVYLGDVLLLGNECVIQKRLSISFVTETVEHRGSSVGHVH